MFTIEAALETDVSAILAFIKELALYERAPLEVTVTEAMLLEDGFGKNKIYDCWVARENGIVQGIALTYIKYSTWKGKCLFLEDIIVKESERGRGIGKELFKKIISISKEQNMGRMEWQVLDWNQTAIDFYNKFDAVLDPTWINCKFTYEQLQAIDFSKV